MKTYAAAPPMTIDASKTYTATVKTVRGDFTIKLRPDLAPKHVNSFVFLARDGYFDHVTFHRVIPGFVAQAGDPTGTGNGSPGYTLPAEFTSAVQFTRGTVGMARLGQNLPTTGPSGQATVIPANDTAGSQWFVTLQNSTDPAGYTQLDGKYTVFGQVTNGMDVVDCLTPRDPSKNPNAAAGDKIVSITIAES